MAGTKFETGIDLRNQIASNAADASAATDLVTKQQLDAAIAGLNWKQPVRVATTTNGTLATAFANAQTIDGVALATGNRILIKDQTTQTENGIYIVTAGAPTRATDADSSAELNGAAVYITSGTVNSERSYTQTTDAPTIGSSNIVWAQFGGGTLPTAGAGLTLTGSVLDVGAAAGITVAADTVGVDFSIVAKTFTIATHASTTSIAITHSLGKQFPAETAVYITSTGERIYPGVVATSTTVTTFTFGTAPGANSLTFVISA
jgi:hypothetical protein